MNTYCDNPLWKYLPFNHYFCLARFLSLPASKSQGKMGPIGLSSTEATFTRKLYKDINIECMYTTILCCYNYTVSNINFRFPTVDVTERCISLLKYLGNL